MSSQQRFHRKIEHQVYYTAFLNKENQNKLKSSKLSRRIQIVCEDKRRNLSGFYPIGIFGGAMGALLSDDGTDCMNHPTEHYSHPQKNFIHQFLSKIISISFEKNVKNLARFYKQTISFSWPKKEKERIIQVKKSQ